MCEKDALQNASFLFTAHFAAQFLCRAGGSLPPYNSFRTEPTMRDRHHRLSRIFHFLYNILMEFSTHSMATPESAKTASHMEA